MELTDRQTQTDRQTDSFHVHLLRDFPYHPELRYFCRRTGLELAMLPKSDSISIHLAEMHHCCRERRTMLNCLGVIRHVFSQAVLAFQVFYNKSECQKDYALLSTVRY